MSGVEIFGIAVSALQIADLGGKVSAKLFGFARKVRGAAEKVDLISKEIAATGALLRQLSEQLDKDSQAQLLRRELVEPANELVQECMKIFKNIDQAIDGNSGNKIILSLKQKIHYTYLESEIDALRANLESLKGSIGIMQNVLIYAEQLRNRERFPALKEQQDLLKTLGEEKLLNEQRHDTLMKAIKQRPDSLPTSSPNPSLAPSQLSIANVPLRSRSLSLSVEDLHISSQAPSPNPSTVSTVLNSHELREYTYLMGHILEEIQSERYTLDKSMRRRFHNGVLDLHWREWAPFRRYYSADVLLRKCGQLPELVLHWENKAKQEDGMRHTPGDWSRELSGARVAQSANWGTKEAKSGVSLPKNIEGSSRAENRPSWRKQAVEEAKAVPNPQARKTKGEDNLAAYCRETELRLPRKRSSKRQFQCAAEATGLKAQTPPIYIQNRRQACPQTFDSFGLRPELDEVRLPSNLSSRPILISFFTFDFANRKLQQV